MKKDITDLFMTLSGEELNKLILLKHGLEDLNLIISEIEDTYKLLDEVELQDSDVSYQRYRLKSLEYYLDEINNRVNEALEHDIDKNSMS